MDDIRRPRRSVTRRSGQLSYTAVPPRPALVRGAPLPAAGQDLRSVHIGRGLSSKSVPAPKRPAVITLHVSPPKFKLPVQWQRWRQSLRSLRVRLSLLFIVAVLVLAQVFTLIQPHLIAHSYALGQGEGLLAGKNSLLASKLKLNDQSGSYNYNANFSIANATTDTNSGGPQIKAVANQDPAKGLQVTDPLSNTEFDITPQFQLLSGKQDGNRVIYPLLNGTGWMVYTMQASGVKEDLILRSANGDSMKLKYKLDLASQGLAAHIEKDGSIGIYGSSLPITGTISTGSSKDAALLQKARNKAKKDKFLFSLPAPVVYETGHVISKTVRSHYELKGDTLATVTSGLKASGTSFPLDVDPAVTVVSSSDLFRDTNPDSNVDLDASTGTGNVSRGQVSGGVVTTGWTANANNLTNARWLNGAAVYDDYAYVAGGAAAGATTNISTVEYASINKNNSSIGSWTTSSTSLPAALSRFQLLIYNGYMYAIGGSTTNTTCGTVTNKIYFNRIQTNGQLSANWTDNSAWPIGSPSGINLPASLCGFGATVYNNKLYIAGGRTGSATSNGSTAVYYAGINPDGSIGSFTTEDSVLPAARYDFDLKAYNNHLYMVGGTLAGTVTGTAYVASLASNGSIYGTTSASWVLTTSLNTARSSMGSAMTAINDGYVYVEGGCNSLNASQTCTSAAANTQADIELAQINADGTLGSWTSLATTVATYAQIGGSLQFWRGTLYIFAGCTSISTTAVQCTTASNTQQYNSVATPGQISPVKSTTALSVALWGHGMAIVNGYIFVIGGCLNSGCQSAASDLTAVVRSAKLNADGTTGAWTATTSIPTAESATAIAVYNNYIYVVGGYDYTAQTNGSAMNTVYYGQVSATGTIASWGTTTYATAGNARYYSSAVAYRGVLYVIGGCYAGAQATGCSTYVKNGYKATLATNGVPGTFSAITTSLPNVTTSQDTCTAVALMAVTVYNGYMYLAGGACSTTYGQSNKIQYAQLTGDITSWNTASGNMTTNGTTNLPIRRGDAYAVNGYLYVIGGHNGVDSSTHGEIQIGKINLSTGNIDNNLQPSITKMTSRWDTRAAFSNGYIYVTGGCTGGTPANTCTSPTTLDEYFQIFNAGNHGTGTWSTPGAYTTNRVGATSVVSGGYIYVAGGCQAYTVGANLGNTTTQCTTPGTNNLNTVSYAPINPDGSLGTWTTSSNNLTTSNARAFGCLAADGGYLYYVGGEDNTGAATATVLYSQLTSNVPGTWSQATGSLTSARRNLSCGIFNDRIYATGGINSSNADTVTVDYSPSVISGGNIGSWTAFGTGFTTARANHTAVVAGGYLYILGGDDGTNVLKDVQFIQLNPSGGSTGSWAYSGDMPQGVTNQSVMAANGYIYLFGGRTAAATCLGSGTAGFTYIASVNNTGILGGWSQAANSFTTPRFGATASFYNGYYYYMGGDDCTNVISANVIQSGGEQSQGMAAQFSKYADLNGNGDPQKLVIYLTNAQLNGVDIEKWKMTYVSSFDAGTSPSWGASTTISPLLDQNAYNVNAYNGSGTDLQLARWFYLSFSIDMTTSFTFTDDTQPAISQYGLHYSPPPSKRLLHGRDFRDQTQQGEDLKL